MSDAYALHAFGEMIADHSRFAAYSQAIAKAVKPGDVVLEIGCGPAVFALLACHAGARRVYAVDVDDIVDFARQLAEANGLSDRIEFFQSDSRKLELPERANVIVSDIRGALPFHNHAIASIEDARQRLLASGGILIPQRDTLKAALIDAADVYTRLLNPWRHAVRELDLSASVPLLLSSSYGHQFKPEQILSDAQTFCVLDYAAGAAERASADLRFTAHRAGTVHGLAIWFETELFAGFGYSTGPGAVNSVYSQLFLPWLAPIELQTGEQVNVQLRADLIGSSYIWQWNTSVAASAGREAVHFRQSTFQGAHFSPRFLRTHATDFTPELSERGDADLWLLQAMNGAVTLQEIARSAAKRFPTLFAGESEALQRASDLAQQYSR